MKDVTFEDITASDKEKSERLTIDLIRTKYPFLDLRSGTALRDLLVTPDAMFDAWLTKRADAIRTSTSLASLAKYAEDGNQIDTEDVDRILSNFNMSGTAGTSSRGVVRITVSQARTYSVSKNAMFETMSGGTRFSVDSDVIADEQPVNSEVKLFKGSANWYFFVPVTCTTVGSDGNIQKGTVLTFLNSFQGFVSATAYGDFSGGSNVESLDSIVGRIPAALSTRGLLNATAAEAVLRDRFDSSEHPVIAVSSVGYGNPAQRRDKHNPFGIGVGGRVDLYVRNFTSPYVKSFTKTFVLNVATGRYECAIPASDARGMYQVRGVSDPESTSVASYSYAVEYDGDGAADTWHDFDLSEDTSELAGTVWRSCRIYVSNTGFTDHQKDFNVDVVCLPDASSIQAYVDENSVRNTGSDFVVRCPAICRVSINARCRYPYGMSFDVDAAKTAIADYINNTGFIGRLTRSEIACVLKSSGATSVDLDDDYMMVGNVVDALGVVHGLSGDSLDIADVETHKGMLTKDTCVFSTAVENINITATPE